MRILKKLFGGLDLSWPKIVIAAVAAGVYTALVCIIPQAVGTSLHSIAATFEVWILFGILIIMNAKSNADAALKCFVFFLISQPLVYLLQVPFSWQGWHLFSYYKTWFVWTVLCLPMGYIGYYIKKDKWWGYLILLPMIGLTAISYHQYLSDFTFCRPFYILVSVFCAAAMIVYPLALFDDKRIRLAGTIVSALLVVGITVFVALNPIRYYVELLNDVDGQALTDEYRVSLADDRYGSVSVGYVGSVGEYMVHAEFTKKGRTELIVEAPDGTVTTYDLTVGLYNYDLKEK